MHASTRPGVTNKYSLRHKVRETSSTPADGRASLRFAHLVPKRIFTHHRACSSYLGPRLNRGRGGESYMQTSNRHERTHTHTHHIIYTTARTTNRFPGARLGPRPCPARHVLPGPSVWISLHDVCTIQHKPYVGLPRLSITGGRSLDDFVHICTTLRYVDIAARQTEKQQMTAADL